MNNGKSSKTGMELMSSYDDMRDMQRREEDPDYITPTFAFTDADLQEMEHDHGDDHLEIVNQVMDRDMERYDRELIRRQQSQIEHLQGLLEEHGIEY